MDILINKNVIVYEENDEIILINMIKNNFYALDYTGSFIWKSIEGSLKIDEIISMLQSKFNAENYREVEDDLLDFLSELEKAGLIKIGKKK